MVLSKKDWAIVRELTITDFKLKYNRSVLGFLWSLIKPFLMLGTLYVVFSIFFRLDVQHYPLFLLLGVILWNFFVEATSLGMYSLTGKVRLIKKLYFPREVIVLSSTISAFISMLLNLAVFVIFLVVFLPGIGISIISFPLLLAELFILALGLAYGLSALYVKFKDMAHIWDVLTQIGFWVTPIVYPLTFIPESILAWYMLNPMARIINDSRNAVIYGVLPSLWHSIITITICAAIYLIGLAIFKKYSKIFGEEV